MTNDWHAPFGERLTRVEVLVWILLTLTGLDLVPFP